MIDLFDVIFENEKMIYVIQNRLPYIVYAFNQEYSRGNATGMEVGIPREKTLVALLKLWFQDSINENVRVNASSGDMQANTTDVSIKTLSGSSTTITQGVKTGWTVDKKRINDFIASYEPHEEILFLHIVWQNPDQTTVYEKYGGLYYIPKEVVQDIYNHYIGRHIDFFQKPKDGKNSRGLMYQSYVMNSMIKHEDTRCIRIYFREPEGIPLDGFTRYNAIVKDLDNLNIPIMDILNKYFIFPKD